MQLTPPAGGHHEYTSLDLLTKKINNHAKTQGYAVIRKRSKQSKLGILMEAFFRCDRGGQWEDEGHGHRLTKSRRNECPFECIAKLDGNEEDPQTGLGNWILTVKYPDHNHPPIYTTASASNTINSAIESL